MHPLSIMWSAGSLAAFSLLAPTFATEYSYTLQQTLTGQSILEHFDFFDGADPTNGFVTYVNQSYAESSGLVEVTSSGSLYLGVDHTTVLSTNGAGRDSVRIESKKYYDQGLYIVDIQHMPGSICGTWPAFWAVGRNWPNDGEIDIIEGVNKHTANEIVLHTSGSCDVSGDNQMSGNLTSSQCGEASGTIGCVVEGTEGSAGTPFNSNGGGIYAMEWEKEFIKIWFFPRSSIPASITAGNPDISDFGTPMAHLEGTCNFQERFASQKFIIDTTFCGDWAGNVFGTSDCPMSDSSSPMQSCISYVAENPTLFKEAYWELNSIKVYKAGNSSSTEVQAPAGISTTQTATEVVPTSTGTITKTRETTILSSTTKSTSSTTEITTPSTATTSVPSAVDPEDSEPVSKITSYVTLTTTVCAASQSQSQVPTAHNVAIPPASSVTSLPSAPVLPTVKSSSTRSIGIETSLASVGTSRPEAPTPVTSIIFTAPQSSPAPQWTIIASSSEIITLPTVSSTASAGDIGDSPTGVRTETSATVPSSPVFTGAASKLCISVTSIVGALVIAMLA